MERITIKQLSAIVPFSQSTLRNFCKKGMPHSKPGKKIILEKNKAMEWLDNYSEAPESPTHEELNNIVSDVISEFI